jgi:hypothetical protein
LPVTLIKCPLCLLWHHHLTIAPHPLIFVNKLVSMVQLLCAAFRPLRCLLATYARKTISPLRLRLCGKSNVYHKYIKKVPYLPNFAMLFYRLLISLIFFIYVMKNLNFNTILMYYEKVQENLTRYDHFCEYYELPNF